jgi:hypothetical protein
MALRVLGCLALFLLLIQPTKADSIDNFNFQNNLIIWSLPSSVPADGVVLQSGDPPTYYVPVPIASWWFSIPFLPSELVLQLPSSPTLFEWAIGCNSYCDGIWSQATSTATPFTVSDGMLTFIPGVYAGLTITETDTPEPGALCLLAIGLLGVRLFRRSVPGT